MSSLEIELTYLAKYLPQDLHQFPSMAIKDFYFPIAHPRLRLRQAGKSYTLTRKSKAQKDDASQHQEQTIHLEKNQYHVIKKLPGVSLSKIRYDYQWEKSSAEIDIFRGQLSGLVLIDFEFPHPNQLKNPEG